MLPSVLDRSQIAEWLSTLQSRIEQEQLLDVEWLLLVQTFAKHQLLLNNKPIEDDDMGWVSLGLLLKSMNTVSITGDVSPVSLSGGGSLTFEG